MKKITGIVLIIFALALGFTGIEQINKSTQSVDIIGVEFSATDQDKRNKGIVCTALGVIFLLSGATLVDDEVWISME